VGARDEVGEVAARIGFPVVLKAVSTTLAHKSEAGGVRAGLTSEDEVEKAAAAMCALSDQFLVERMVGGATVELIVGVHRDPQFGLAITIGAGGVLVDLLEDTATLLLPATPADIRGALGSLHIWPLLQGFRGQTADVDSVVDAVSSILGYARQHADLLVELEVNPLLVLPDGAVAVDALIRLTETDAHECPALLSSDLEEIG